MMDTILAGILVTLLVAGLTVAAHSVRRCLQRRPSEYQALRAAGRRAQGDRWRPVTP